MSEPREPRARLRDLPTRLAIAAMGALARLPLGAWRPAGAFIGTALRLLGARRRRIAETNLRLCFPALDEGARRKLLHDHYRSLGLSIVEMAAAWRAPHAQLAGLAEVVGLEHLERARAEGRGVLLVTAHFTYLEMGARLIAAAWPVHPMYRRNKKPLLDRFILEARAANMAEPVERGDTRKLVRLLKRGGVVWYAPDQNYGLRHGLFAPFFGIPAATITATSRLARMGDALVVPYHPRRLPDGRYRLEILPPLTGYPSGNDAADAARINRWIEAAVRRAPADYLWIHRRFKTRPEGEPGFYR